MDKCCGNCGWHGEFCSVCFNPDSEWHEEFVDDAYYCEVWEGKADA